MIYIVALFRVFLFRSFLFLFNQNYQSFPCCSQEDLPHPEATKVSPLSFPQAAGRFCEQRSQSQSFALS